MTVDSIQLGDIVQWVDRNLHVGVVSNTEAWRDPLNGDVYVELTERQDADTVCNVVLGLLEPFEGADTTDLQALQRYVLSSVLAEEGATAMTDSDSPKTALTAEQETALEEITSEFLNDIAWARNEYGDNIRAAYSDYAKYLLRAGIDPQQYPAPPIDTESA